MNVAQKLLVAGVCALPALSAAGNQNPSVPPLADSWPTYSGDYSGQRYSALTQINQANVKNRTLAWVARPTGVVHAGGGGILSPPGAPEVVGGEAGEALVTGVLFASGSPSSVCGCVYHDP